MTNLTGSDKQTTWASDIIHKFEREYTTYAERFAAAGNTDDAKKLTDGVATLIAAHTEAAWWIDHQGSHLRDELKTVVMA